MASLKNAILTNFWPKVGLDCYCNPFFWPSKNNAQKTKSDFFAKSLIFAKWALARPRFNFFHFFCLKPLLKNPVKAGKPKNGQKY